MLFRNDFLSWVRGPVRRRPTSKGVRKFTATEKLHLEGSLLEKEGDDQQGSQTHTHVIRDHIDSLPYLCSNDKKVSHIGLMGSLT